MFYSMRSVMHELGDPIKSNLEIVSMHSVSKGFTGECGLRGGYFEFENLDPFAKEMLYKLKSMKLCAPTPGMIAVGIIYLLITFFLLNIQVYFFLSLINFDFNDELITFFLIYLYFLILSFWKYIIHT